MDLSIIIAHYNPISHPTSHLSFHKTLSIICDQKGNRNIEIIIGDDGSPNNNEIINNFSYEIIQSGEKVFCITENKLKNWKINNEYQYSALKKWLYYPKNNNSMNKARLANAAIQTAESDYLLFLDDDNYFISKNSIEETLNHLHDFDLVFGQIKDSNGKLRKFGSNRVQGTTFAIKKEIIQKVSGFGEWTELVSSGVDSDIWWKLYHYFIRNPKLRVCYTSKIQTIDSCSKRWKPFIKNYFRHYIVKKHFYNVHGCINYRNTKYNPSRIKSNWMEDLT